MPSIDGKLLRIEFMQIPNGGWFQSKGGKKRWNRRILARVLCRILLVFIISEVDEVRCTSYASLLDLTVDTCACGGT